MTLRAPSADAALSTWLTYLEALHPSTIELGLERVNEVAERLRLRHFEMPVITVAGTNGKGSTVRMLEVILQQAGYQTFVYVSPHLYRYNERVRVNQQELDDTAHVAAFAAIEAARGDISLTYFEFGTLAALWLAQHGYIHELISKPEVLILEVGLGGRLDAVNTVAADVAIITSIGLDHTAWLGDTTAAIAQEKAGIFRTNRVAICGEPEPPATIAATAHALGANLQQVRQDYDYQLENDSWSFRHPLLTLTQLPLPQLPVANAATVLAAIANLARLAKPLRVTQSHIEKGLTEARLAGRLQLLPGHPDTLLDVAHNPHAAAFLRETLAQRYPGRPLYAVVGMLHDKDIKATLAELVNLVDLWFCVDLAQPRGASAKQLQAALPASAVSSQYDSVAAAYRSAVKQAQQAQQQAPIVLIFGSFYTVGSLSVDELYRLQQSVIDG